MKTILTLFLGLTLMSPLRAQVLPPHSSLFGKSLAEYSVDWFQYNFSLSTNHDPVFLPAGSRGNEPVRFLAASAFAGPGQQPVFTIPENVYVFFPIVTIWADNVDTDPPFTVPELRDLIAGVMTLVTNLHASIDGLEIPVPLDYREPSPAFSFCFENPDNQYSQTYGRPFVGLVDPIVADGYYLMVEPLAVGDHTLVTGAAFDSPLGGSSFTTVFHFRVHAVPLDQRVQELISRMVMAGLPPKTGKPLLKKLEEAQRSFAKGHLKSGIHQLLDFQHKVSKELERADPALAADLIQRAQRIVERAMSELNMTPVPEDSAGVLPNDAVVDGKTIGEWSAEWFRSFYTLGTNVSPMFDPDGRSATNGQPPGAVFFLGSGTGFETNQIHRTFAVPEGKYLFVPLLVATIDNIDTFPPLTIEEMREGITAFLDNPRELQASIDGVAVSNLLQHRAATPVFSVDYPNADNYVTVVYGHPIVGLVDPMLGDGYWLMIEPLPPGAHVLRYRGAYGLPFYSPTDITANITVVPVPLPERVQELMSRVELAGLPPKTSKPLLKKLDEAQRSFAKSHLKSGIDQLLDFQHAVLKELERSDPAVAEALIQAAEQIIDRAKARLP